MTAALFAVPSFSGLAILCLFAILIPWILEEMEEENEDQTQRN